MKKLGIQKEVYHIVVIQTICGNQEQNGDYINIAPIPNSTNYIYEFNHYVGGLDDEYVTKLAIVSNIEKDTILKHWDAIQDRHETQFEIDYMNSTQKDRAFFEEEHEDDEEEM